MRIITRIKSKIMKMLDERELKIMCETIKKEHPDKDADYYKMFLSTEVLRLMIDNEWVNQAVFKQHPNKEKKNNAAFDYLRSGANGYEWQERVSKLAERVYNLRRVPNIENIIDKIKSGELLSSYAELEVGSHLYSRGISIEFVIPKGIKGQDFDIKITSPLVVNCEVKHKIESTAISQNTLTDAIRSANDQIPHDEPAIIFIKIPEGWLSDQSFNEIINKAFEPFFERNSTHIIGIMLRWEQSDTQVPGIFYWKYNFYENKHYKTTTDIKAFTERLQDMSTNWISFSEIVRKYILLNN
jgi:hypothetical protein